MIYRAIEELAQRLEDEFVPRVPDVRDAVAVLRWLPGLLNRMHPNPTVLESLVGKEWGQQFPNTAEVLSASFGGEPHVNKPFPTATEELSTMADLIEAATIAAPRPTQEADTVGAASVQEWQTWKPLPPRWVELPVTKADSMFEPHRVLASAVLAIVHQPTNPVHKTTQVILTGGVLLYTSLTPDEAAKVVWG